MPINRLIYNNWFVAIATTLLLYLVCYILFGFYYGWLDDIQVLALYKGLFTPKGLAGPDHHILLAHVFIWLYKIAPSIPWYGAIHHLILAIGITLMNFMLLSKINKEDGHHIFKLIALTCFFIVFIFEMISFFNFTYISMFIAIIGLVSAIQRYSKLCRAIGIVLLALSILIRMEAAVFILLFVGLIIFFKDYKSIFSRNFLLPGGVIILTLLVVSYVKMNPTQESLRFLIKNDAVVLSIHEAKNVDYNWDSPEDSIKVEALTSWNFFDKYAIDEAFLYKVSNKFYSKKMISSYFSVPVIKQKLQDAYLSSFRYPSDYNGYNWRSKFLVLFISILILLDLLYLISNSKSKRNIFSVLAVFLLWLFTLILLSVVLKLEDRIIFPSLFLFGYFIIDLILDIKIENKRDKKLVYYILIILLSCSSIQLNRLNSFAHQKKKEINQKRALLAEINSVNNKTFLLDFHAIYLIHDTPFKDIKLNKSNEYHVAAHYWLLAFEEIQNYYKNLCGSDRIDHIMEYYQNQKDDVILIKHELNKSILEDYLKLVYDKDIRFNVLENESMTSINDIKYSYIYYPLEFNFYTFD